MARKKIGGKRWKLNDNLLLQKDISDKYKKDRAEFFKLNTTEDMAITTIWEARRGNLITISSKKKRGGNGGGKKIIERIQILKDQHS